MNINQQVSGAFFNPTKGIYKITNTITGRVYIGQSRRVQSRLSSHFGDLADGKHSSRLMQADWTEYGPDSFSIEVVEHVDGQNNRLLREAEIIADALSAGLGVYNTVITDPESIKNNAITKERKRIERERVEADKQARLERKNQARLKANAEKEARRARSSETATRRENDIFGRWGLSEPEPFARMESGQERILFPETDLCPGKEGVDRAAETERPPAKGVDANGLSGESHRDISEALPEYEDYYIDNEDGNYLGASGVSGEQWEDDLCHFTHYLENESMNSDWLAWYLRTYIKQDVLEEVKEKLTADDLMFFNFTKEQADALFRKLDSEGMTFSEMIHNVATYGLQDDTGAKGAGQRGGKG